jgi:hypothetical protein
MELAFILWGGFFFFLGRYTSAFIFDKKDPILRRQFTRKIEEEVYGDDDDMFYPND